MSMDNRQDGYIHRFSLNALLSIIEGTTIEFVKMRIAWNNKGLISWMKQLWESHSQGIIQKYQDKHYRIRYNIAKDSNDEMIEISKQ